MKKQLELLLTGWEGNHGEFGDDFADYCEDDNKDIDRFAIWSWWSLETNTSSGNSGDDDDDIDKRWKGTLSLVTRSTWGTGVKFNISTLPIRASTSRG